MPIRPDLKARYPADWEQIRQRMLARAGQRRIGAVVTREACCEWCGVENHAMGLRKSDGSFVELSQGDAEAAHMDGEHVILIVLTVAHVHDRNPENCEDENLAVLCQRCHLRHDLPQHLVSRVENEIERDVAAGQMLLSDLLQETRS
jgi:hypothetical protein